MKRLATLTIALALVLPLAHSPMAAGDSAPDLGRPFEPRPLSTPIYAIQAPTDENGQRFFVDASDGEQLFIEAWLPTAKDGHRPPTRVPTVLVITPYARPGVTGNQDLERARLHLVPRGYAFVVSHIRGTGGSSGCLDQRGPQEIDDSSRVVAWLGLEAPWTTGVVGMYGISYYGGTQIGVAARGDAGRTKYLKAIVAKAPWSSVYENYRFDGVRFFLQHEVLALNYHYSFGVPSAPTPFDVPERLACAPEHEAAALDRTGGVTEYFRARDDRVGAHTIRAATLMIHGHADMTVYPSVQAGLFDRIPDSTPKAGLFGWWAHEDPGTHQTSEIYPEWIRSDYLDMVTSWFDRYLKLLPTGADEWPVSQVQGNDGQWRTEPDWPSTGGPVGQLALGAAGSLGIGRPTGATSYTEGGFAGPSTPELPGTYAVFETAPLPDRLEITGLPVADLWVKLNRPDATIGLLVETFGPDGERLGVRVKDNQGMPIDTGATRGFRSARFLRPLVDGRFWQGSPETPPLETPLRIQVRLYPTDLVIPKGGRVRITVAASQTARSGFEGIPTLFTDNDVQYPSLAEGPSQPSGRATTVTILHDCEHPSALRFLMPRANPDLLNVREKDEPADQPLADNRPFVAPASDAGGLATAPVCGQAPIRLENFGPEIPYEPPS